MAKTKLKTLPAPAAPAYTIASLIDEATRCGIQLPADQRESLAGLALLQPDPLGYLRQYSAAAAPTPAAAPSFVEHVTKILEDVADSLEVPKDLLVVKPGDELPSGHVLSAAEAGGETVRIDNLREWTIDEPGDYRPQSNLLDKLVREGIAGVSIETLPPLEEVQLPTDEGVVHIAIEAIPLADYEPHAKVSRRLDVHFGGPDRELAKTLKRVFEGLYRSGTKLPGDRPIGSTADAIRWILYRMQDAAKLKAD